jgi:hypothetical protein
MKKLRLMFVLSALAVAGCAPLPPSPPAPVGPAPQWAGVYAGSCDLLVQAGEERKACDPLLFVSIFPARTKNFVLQTAAGLVVGFRTKPTAVSAQHNDVSDVVIDKYPPLPALGHCDFVLGDGHKGSLFCECYAGGKAYRAHFRITGLKQASGSLPP